MLWLEARPIRVALKGKRQGNGVVPLWNPKQRAKVHGCALESLLGCDSKPLRRAKHRQAEQRRRECIVRVIAAETLRLEMCLEPIQASCKRVFDFEPVSTRDQCRPPAAVRLRSLYNAPHKCGALT